MSYKISHSFTGHSYILEEYDDKVEAIAAINKMINEWGEPDPTDEFLELYYYNEETEEMIDEIVVHYLTDPDTWEED
jgi:hypothetical protein